MSTHRCRSCEPVPEELRRAVELLERRWTLSILWAAHAGAVRFNEFRSSLGTVSPRTLALRLVELEDAGLIERRVFDARPPRVEYRLTESGRRLDGLLEAVRSWAVARP